MRRFHFLREKDTSGVSGIGRIAEGVIFSNGKVALEWFGSHASTNLYDSLNDVEYIHGHAGMTKIVFEDPDDVAVDIPNEDMKNDKTKNSIVTINSNCCVGKSEKLFEFGEDKKFLTNMIMCLSFRYYMRM